jgi:flavin-dependent dehydrogenase
MVDVAVVGGGPAGCAAALTLRTCGVVTTIIASPRPREKPTETAVPRLKHLLQSLGAGEALVACEPCYGIESSWGAPGPVLRPTILDPSGHAWFIHRDRFDASLVRLAGAAGAVRLEAEATSVSFADDRVIVSTTAGPVEAKSLVIATGSPAWAARATGQKPVTMDSLLCYWARLAVPIESRLLHVESTESGWWYVCTGEAATMHACFLTDAKGSRQFAPSKPEQWNALFQQTRLSHQHVLGDRAGQIHCLPVSVAGLACRHGPRWVAAGDAALKLDPIGSSGTATALESGALAARALLAGEQGNTAAAESYDRWGNGLLAEFLKRRTPLYAAETQKYPVGFWARRAHFPK